MNEEQHPSDSGEARGPQPRGAQPSASQPTGFRTPLDPPPPSSTASYSYYEASVPPERPPLIPGMHTPAADEQPNRHPQRRSNKLVAGLVAAALVVGAGAGIGGAALLSGDDNDSDEAPTSQTQTETGGDKSPVVSEDPNEPAQEGSAEEVAAKVLPSVVMINVVGSRSAGSGSGVVISSDGEILTNNHVVALAGDGGSISVNFNDGTTATATVVGTDALTDLAVIKAEGVSGLTPATLNSADSVDVGESVLAVGSPFGLDATVTSGIVSALNRPVTVSDETYGGQDTTYPAIQTDAAINPGNSGGPLVNMKGEVIGINSSIRSASSGYGSEAGSIGLGFAIPISKVLPIVEQLRKGETATHARLGVSLAQLNNEDPLAKGATIAEVSAGSAAEKAGIKVGDVITKVDDYLVVDGESLIATIRGYRPGDTVTITIKRGSETQEVKATLDSDGGQVAS